MDKMIIIGAGIAGGMARGYFASMMPQIYEARRTNESNHKAIMRYRDPSIGFLLGTHLEKISVKKAIYYQGKFIDQNPMVLNMYSRKVAKGIYERSISSISSVDRFVSNEPLNIPSVNYGFKLKGIENGICEFENKEKIKYDVCVSTIPLSTMVRIVGSSFGGVKVESYPIHVYRYKVSLPSEVYQTIYFPDETLSVYRVSLERQDFIIESQTEFIDNEIPEVCHAFGFHHDYLCEDHHYIQDNGKIVEMDDTERKRIIMELTDRFNIYSLGRYATWRNITADVLLDDLPKLAKLMKLSDASRKYSMAL